MTDRAATISKPCDETVCPDRDHLIIAGYGVPGRAVAEQARRAGIPFCVIELNANVVDRCAKGGVHIVEGNVTDPAILRLACIENARLIVLAMPDEKSVLGALRAIRSLNATIKIVARTHYVSVGMEAKAQGADEVVTAEQVVATELARIVDQCLSPASKSC